MELIESLPLVIGAESGLRQAMPSERDLALLLSDDTASASRTAHGYEVLLHHWREQGKEIERLVAKIAELPTTKDGVSVIPDDRVWSINEHGIIRNGDVFCNAGWGVMIHWPSGNPLWPNQYTTSVESCYSTCVLAEVALKARTETEGE